MHIFYVFMVADYAIVYIMHFFTFEMHFTNKGLGYYRSVQRCTSVVLVGNSSY